MKASLIELPVAISIEERKSSRVCRESKFFISVFTCLQCEHFELHNELTAEVVKRAGACAFPRRASKVSRGVTDLFALKVQGKVEKDVSLSDRCEARLKRSKRSDGGMHAKRDFLVTLIQQGISKTTALVQLGAKFSQMSEAYKTTLYYQAKKEVREIKGAVDSFSEASK